MSWGPPGGSEGGREGGREGREGWVGIYGGPMLWLVATVGLLPQG